MLDIAVILGSTRRGRFGEKPARWIFDELKKRPGVDAEFIDLRDYEMPFFDEPVSPGWITEPYRNEAVARWTKKIAAEDGFIVVAPEYNRSAAGVMKNAFDWSTRSGTGSRSVSSATATPAAPAASSTCAQPPSSCRWRRSAPRFTCRSRSISR